MRSRRWLRLVLLSVLMLGMSVAASDAAVVFTEKGVSTGTFATESNPEADGRYVVYEHVPTLGLIGDTLDSDIRAYDVGTGDTTNLSDPTDDDYDQTNPDISGDLVVWQSNEGLNPAIYAYGITWTSKKQVTNTASNQTRPRVSGNYVIWHSSATNSLWWYDYATPQYQNHEIPGSVGAEAWDIDGDRVVFSVSPAASTHDLYVWNVASNSSPTKFRTVTGDVLSQVRLHYDTVVYSYEDTASRVGLAVISAGTATPLAINAREGDAFHSSACWNDSSSGSIAFKGPGGWLAAIGGNDDIEADPSMFGSRVAYERDTLNGDVLMSVTSAEVTRTQGATRYDTAVELSRAYFAKANSAVLCTGQNFPDALSAAPWARLLRAPLLLTRKDSVPDSVIAELGRLGVSNVWIIGGEAAVSSAVTDQLEDEGFSVNRELQGVDRYNTSRLIAYRIYDALGSDDRPFSGYAFFANGNSFADALSVAPVAASRYTPILLVNTHSVPAATASALQYLPIKYGVIVGGESVVGADVELTLEAYMAAKKGSASPAERWSGPDRYATSVSVLQNAVSANWLDLDTVGFATGLNFPDALGGGAALGLYGSPLLLTSPNSLPAKVNDVLTQRAAEIGRVDIFGGADVVSDGVKASITSIVDAGIF